MLKKNFSRVSAIAIKEWRLNLRFVAEYFINHLVTPIKSALVMLFLYSGFFKSTTSYLGSVTKENYLAYVLLGSILHSQFTNAAGVLSGKLIAEKYWQTALATVLSPASIYEVLMGFAIGSGGLTLFVNVLLLCAVTFFHPIPFSSFLIAVFVLFLIALLGFGLGLFGATIGLVWEGMLFIYFYGLQAITLLSCLYYPIGILPEFLQPLVKLMPTYQLGEVMHSLYLGTPNPQILFPIMYMIATCIVVLVTGGFLYNHSVRKYGIVGY